MTEWPNEIDGLAVLRRIREDRGRVRLDIINDSMATAALDAARRLLREQPMNAFAAAELTQLASHISKVLDARHRRRSR